MSIYSPGDTVQIAAELNEEFPHIAGVLGVVEKVFEDEDGNEFHIVVFKIGDDDRAFFPVLTEAQLEGFAILDPEDDDWFVNQWTMEAVPE